MYDDKKNSKSSEKLLLEKKVFVSLFGVMNKYS